MTIGITPVSLIGIVDHLLGDVDPNNAGGNHREGRDKQGAISISTLLNIYINVNVNILILILQY